MSSATQYLKELQYFQPEFWLSEMPSAPFISVNRDSTLQNFGNSIKRNFGLFSYVLSVTPGITDILVISEIIEALEWILCLFIFSHYYLNTRTNHKFNTLQFGTQVASVDGIKKCLNVELHCI